MSQEYIEITERTISEAITVACQKLGVPSERLEYEVIDAGKTGFLGIGARAAKIRARIKGGAEDSSEFDTSAIISDVLKGKEEKKKSSREEKKENKKNTGGSASRNVKNSASRKAAGNAQEQRPAAKKEKAEASDTQMEETVKKEMAGSAAASADVAEEIRETAEKNPAGKREHGGRNTERGTRDRSRNHRRFRRPEREDREERNEQEREASVPKKRSAVPVLTDEQIEEVKQRACSFLADVFEAMDLDAEVSSSYDKENGMLTIDMKGENMGMLIGKRGQTLDSLQYLVSLVVNKGIDGYIHVKADTENYRERRKKTLENLAKNIASKVKRNRSSVALEPMNPYERRIIHSALQGDRYVTTYSEGEEPYRKVVVTMKEDR